jgi:hypothetical protein
VSATAQPAFRPDVQPVDAFLPTTFLERGVAVPFTTPQLNGARARPGERNPLELVVQNPSGGRGVYILSWDHISSLYTLTLNDRRLIEAVVKLRGVTPDTIRDTAREVASEGLAGRGAVTAAKKARDSDDLERLQANFDLLLELVRQTERKGECTLPPEQAPPLELEQRGKRAVARMAPKLGCTVDAIATALEQLAALFRGVGVRQPARVARAIGSLIRVRREIIKYADSNPEENANEAILVANAADLTIMLAKSTLADAQATTGNIAALLRNWARDPGEIARLLARPDWLLDGWDRIGALWDTTPDTADTLVEMAALVPVVPREADHWLSYRLGNAVDLPRYRSKVVQQLEDWRTGVTVSDLVSRNEALLEKTL